jgi:uncharacterized protein (TIGR00725 family)
LRSRQIAVVGGGADDPELAELAEDVGRRVAAAGVVLVCGGGGGVMEAAARGARESGGDVVGVLPTESPDDANPHVTHAVATGMGHARNLAVVASADAVIAIGGEWGTLAEIAFTRRLERPVVALDSWAVRGRGAMRDSPEIEAVGSPAQAVERALALAAAATQSPRAR